MRLGRLRASGDLVEIGAALLALDAEETRAVAASGGLELSEEAAEALRERTEGWAAAVALATLSLRGRDDAATRAAGLTGNQQQIADYLLEEVLERQPDNLKTFLLGTSILDRMTAPLCDAVLGTNDAADSLEALARSNAFVVPLDDRGEWYRYHHLFSDFLRAELKRRHPELLPVYLKRAADWCELHGSPDEAFAYAHESGDLAQAGRIALGHWDELAGRGQIETLRLWLDRCTDEEIESDAQLSIAAAWVSVLLGDPVRARRFVAAAERRPLDVASADGATSLRSALANVRSAVAPDGIPGCCVTPSSSTPRRSTRAPAGFSAPVALWGRRTFSWADRKKRSLCSARHSLCRATGPSSRTCGSSVSAIWPSRPQRSAIGETRSDGRSKRYGWSKKRVSTTQPRAPSPTRQERSRTSSAVTTRRPRASSRTSGGSAHCSTGSRGSKPICALRCADISLDLGDLAGALEFAQVASDALQGYPDAGTLPARLQRLEERIRRGQDYGLTPAELRLVGFLPTHLSLQEIADRLHLSRPTVKTHVASIYHKLGVKSRSEAVEIVEQAGLGAIDGRLTIPDPASD